VTAHAAEGILLFDVSLAAGLHIEPSTWRTHALAETATGPVAFDVTLPNDAVVGAPDWYLTRIGFWHGAIGPAACWAGGALSLIDAVRSLDRRGAHARAHLGALEALAWNLQTILEHAGREIDQDPADHTHCAKRRALICRHLIERQAVEIMDRFGRASGPQLLAFDEFAARQYAGLTVYIRQCHAEKDDEAIAETSARSPRPPYGRGGLRRAARNSDGRARVDGGRRRAVRASMGGASVDGRCERRRAVRASTGGASATALSGASCPA